MIRVPKDFQISQLHTSPKKGESFYDLSEKCLHNGDMSNKVGIVLRLTYFQIELAKCRFNFLGMQSKITSWEKYRLEQ